MNAQIKKNPAFRFATAAIFGIALVSNLQACTDEEFATGLGIVAIGAGVVAIGIANGDDNDHGRDRGHYECRGGYVERCHDYTDYNGYRRTECSSYYDSCADRVWRTNGHNDLMSRNDSVLAAIAPKGVAVVGKEPLTDALRAKWSAGFVMSKAGAKTFLAALDAARTKGSTKELEALGLDHRDLRDLAKLDMPRDSSVEDLAKNLNQSVSSTREMLKRILVQAKKMKN